ncbi:MAG: peptidase U32 family protein [Lentisphaeria bacterium]
MSKNVKTPELLAPASDLKTALTAFANGADAVYAGLKKFNARTRAQNLSLSEFADLAAYAEDRGKKVYLTFNTLLKEDELKEAVDYLVEIAAIRPHAVLVQDLGILYLLREQFPELTLHASTQMGTHNSSGVSALADLGINRVILERQLSISEIAEITAKSPIETEIFIHGALCCGLSGQCLFSSWMGGMSGNRGRCKQPCRRRYHHPAGNGFYFSPKDLYTLDLIPALMDTGVTSFKIEGRLKDADYIGRTVKAYRMMMESQPENYRERLGEAKNILAGALGREWSHGFYTEESCRELIKYNALGVAGLRCGKVVEIKDSGFTCRCSRPIQPGDKLRVQPPSGEEGPSFIVKTVKTLDGRAIGKSRKGQTILLECDSPVSAGGAVYKIALPESTGTTMTASPPDAESRIRPDIDIDLNQRGITCTFKTSFIELQWQQDCSAIEPARQQALTAEKVRDEFSKSLDTGILPRRISVTLDSNLFLPFKVLRSLRREFWEWTGTRLDSEDYPALKSDKTARLYEFIREAPNGIPAESSARRQTEEITIYYGENNPATREGTESDKVIARNIHSSFEGYCDEAVLPGFCSEADLSDLKQSIQAAHSNGIRRFRITALFGFELLKDYPDIQLSCSFPLPVANSLALKAVLKAGAGKAMAWPELDKENLEHLLHSGKDKIEVYKFGRLPLLITRAQIPVEGQVSDSRGGKFHIRKEGELTVLYPEHPFYLSDNYKVAEFYDITTADLEEKTTSDFNINRDWH